jgi:hypothetical protein
VKKLCLVLLSMSIWTGGCTTSYMVHVNGFSELDQPIKEKASIYVAVDPNSRNPIFDNEIKTKIEMLLKEHDYIPTSGVEHSDYRLTFKVGLDSRRVSGYTPIYRPYFGFYDRYWGNYHFGYYGYVPYIDTYYDQWLVIKVFACEPDMNLRTEKVIWIGEAMIDSDTADLRQVVNYLLVAGFEYFGRDTNRQITLKIKPDNPRIIKITTIR